MNPISHVKERVLLVDDEPQMLVALEDLLSDDFVILKANTGLSALNVLEREREVAVVIADHRMPEMTGVEFLSRLGDTSSALRILLTGFADVPALMRAVNDGRIFAYLAKPWDPDDLHLKVVRAAEHFRMATELARERQLLRERTTILNSVLDSVADGVVVAAKTGEFLLFNREAEKLLGTNANDVSVATWVETCGVHSTDQATPLPSVENPFGRGMFERAEVEVFVRNRVTPGATVAMTATPLRSDDDTLSGSVALLRDVTERRRLEQRLIQSEKLEAIGRLAGSVAHDFNNLLAVMQNYGDLILERVAEGDPMRDDLEQLLLAVQRASALTKQLLAFGRREVVQPRTLDLNVVVANVLTMLDPLLRDRIETEARFSPSVLPVCIDAIQIEQIILNLITNARDAMPHGGRLFVDTADVIVDEADTDAGIPPGRFVVLTVADTGVGIDLATQKKMFEPFFTTKAPGKGTGLGLSTVSDIVQGNKGHIRVDSETGRGTRFAIHLPRAEGLPEISPPSRRTVGPSPTGSATILVVDDNDALRRVAARILRQHDYVVVEAGDANDARIALEKCGAKVDLLLTDVTVPESEPDFAAELARSRPGLRVLYMSGYLAARTLPPDDQLEPSVGHLAKPFTARTLLEEVSRLLETRG